LLPLPHRLGEFAETLGGAVDRRDPAPVAEQAQHQFPADPAGGARHDRHALLFAHPLLLFRCAILPPSLRERRSNLVPWRTSSEIAASPLGLLAMTVLFPA